MASSTQNTECKVRVDVAGLLIGTGGRKIRELQEKTGADIVVSNERIWGEGGLYKQVIIKGTSEQIVAGVKAVKDFLGSRRIRTILENPPKHPNKWNTSGQKRRRQFRAQDDKGWVTVIPSGKGTAQERMNRHFRNQVQEERRCERKRWASGTKFNWADAAIDEDKLKKIVDAKTEGRWRRVGC